MKRSEAIFMIVVGLVLGTVFTFGVSYFNAPTELEEAITTEATFFSYEVSYGTSIVGPHRIKRASKGLLVHFTDYEALDIHSVCDSPALREKLDELPPGARVSLMIHPNASTILDMCYNDTVYLEFNEVTKRLSRERYGFLALGILLYLAAVYCAAWLIRYQVLLTRYRRQKQEKK